MCETHFTIQDPDGLKTSTEYKLNVKKEFAEWSGNKFYNDLVEIDWASPSSKLDVVEHRRFYTANLDDDQAYWMNF